MVDWDIGEDNCICDEVTHYLFQATYYMRKELICFLKFSGLCSLLIKVKANMTEKLYHDDFFYNEIISYISSVVQEKVQIGSEILSF